MKPLYPPIFLTIAISLGIFAPEVAAAAASEKEKSGKSAGASELVGFAALDDLDPHDDLGSGSRLSFRAGSGSSGMVTSSLDFDLGLSEGARLGLGVGGSWGKTAGGPIQTNQARFSFGTDPLSLFSLSASYERWGQFSVIETETFRLGPAIGTNLFFLEVMPEYRTIAWFAQASLMSTKRIYSSSSGISAHASVSGLGPLSVSLSGAKYWYKDLPASFDDLAIVGFVSNTSLDAGASFLSSSGSAQVTWKFSKWSLGGGYSQSQAVIDGFVNFGALVNLDLFPANSWSVSLTAGQNWSDPSLAASYFGEAGYSYFW